MNYESDIVAWANEQARLLRARRFDALDIEHLADEIEDVGKSEQRELASRMAVLVAHLLKWRHQPERRGSRWEVTIRGQRDSIARRLRKTPSLKVSPADTDGWADVWSDALADAVRETELGRECFPEACPWTVDEILRAGFWPDKPE